MATCPDCGGTGKKEGSKGDTQCCLRCQCTGEINSKEEKPKFVSPTNRGKK